MSLFLITVRMGPRSMEDIESLVWAQNYDKLDFLIVLVVQRCNNMIKCGELKILEVVSQGDFYLLELMQRD